MKITFKLPMADELAAALCDMSDADAGAAFKAALVYLAGGETPTLPAAAQGAFEAMRGLIDLSRMRARAGRAGGKTESFAGSKQDFAGSKPIFVGSKTEEAPRPPDGFDVLAGLDAFL
ncbi:MAG: hypothetical protein LBG83_04980 [Oscillospiraceae bacterium]|jgi:hypothetical protein|nr:hypothetical protein [Oscillospiraceae bacterium]